MSRAEDIFQKLIYFGEDAIDEFILTSQTEELFLDFKQAVSSGKILLRCIVMTAKIWPRPFPVLAIPKAGLLSGGWSAPVILRSAMLPRPKSRLKMCTVF